MSKEEILGMEVGKKLDALVGKEIFGKSIMYFSNEWEDRGISQNWDDGYRFYHPCLPNGRQFDDYSTDISAAWQVVEKLNKMGYGIMITVFDPSQVAYPIDKVLCEINDLKVPFNKSPIMAKSYGDEFPVAICKAALLAKLEVIPCNKE